jgi:hypothetical protein
MTLGRRISANSRLVAAHEPDDRTGVTLPIAADDDQSQHGPNQTSRLAILLAREDFGGFEGSRVAANMCAG